VTGARDLGDCVGDVTARKISSAANSFESRMTARYTAVVLQHLIIRITIWLISWITRPRPLVLLALIAKRDRRQIIPCFERGKEDVNDGTCDSAEHCTIRFGHQLRIVAISPYLARNADAPLLPRVRLRRRREERVEAWRNELVEEPPRVVARDWVEPRVPVHIHPIHVSRRVALGPSPEFGEVDAVSDVHDFVIEERVFVRGVALSLARVGVGVVVASGEGASFVGDAPPDVEGEVVVVVVDFAVAVEVFVVEGGGAEVAGDGEEVGGVGDAVAVCVGEGEEDRDAVGGVAEFFLWGAVGVERGDEVAAEVVEEEGAGFLRAVGGLVPVVGSVGGAADHAVGGRAAGAFAWAGVADGADHGARVVDGGAWGKEESDGEAKRRSGGRTLCLSGGAVGLWRRGGGGGAEPSPGSRRSPSFRACAREVGGLAEGGG